MLIIKKESPGAMNVPRPIALAIYQGEIRLNVSQDNSYLQAVVHAPVQAETWHHVVVQVSEVAAELFIDGAKVSTGVLSGSPIDNDHLYTVGAAPSSGTYNAFLQGYLYNLRITEGFAYSDDFVPCEVDPLDADSLFIDGIGPVPCACQPQCGGKSCGGDGCSGQCGECAPGMNCVAGICLASPVECLAAHYLLDGSGADASGSGNHCTLMGPVPAADRFELTSRAVAFDGVDHYINCQDKDLLEDTAEFTLSLWVQLDSLGANPLINKWYSSDTNGRNSYALKHTGDSFIVMVSNGTLAYNKHEFPHATQTDTWYHVAAMFNAGTVEVFVNGQSLGTKQGNITAIGNVDDPLKFGDWYHAYNPANPNPAYYPLHGTLDDVRMFTCALGKTDIEALAGTP
jgi:hypothetical protein